MRGKTLALATLGTYAATCGLLFLQQTRLLYRPPRTQKAHEKDTQLILPASLTLPAMHGWVDNPGQAQALVYCGGSSEEVELRREAAAQAFPDHTRYFMPYRGFGPNKGLTPTEGGLKDDSLRLFDLVGNRHQSVDVLGRSLGTSIALHLSARRPARRLGLITPFDSIVRVAQGRYKVFPVAKLLRDHHEAWKDACNIQMPAMVCLAGKDKVTPRVRFDQLVPHFKVQPIIVEDPTSDHSSIAASMVMWGALQQFFGASALEHVAREGARMDQSGTSGALAVPV